MKTEIMVHCGNSPKMERVIDLTAALAGKDAELVKQYVRDDFTWKTVGEDAVISFEKLNKELDNRPPVKELSVTNALSHGNGAMCEGTLLFEDGDVLQFCTVVKFVNTAKNALIKEAHTYFAN
ncbi:hypothetical protein IRB23SM22_05610 [Alkalibacterium sp. s-m-22]